MSEGRSSDDRRKLRVALFSADPNFVATAQSMLKVNEVAGLSIVDRHVSGQSVEDDIRDATIVIVDVATSDQEDLSEFQHLLVRMGRDLPIIAVVDEFNEAVARKLVQMRAAEILVKPVAPVELLRACARIAPTKCAESQIYTFLPVTGGVGTTTIAIQSALALLGDKTRGGRSTCLIDLNFRNGACAEYLDIDARLNLKEIELQPERLDQQLLGGMLAQHSSGLAVIAAPNLPTEVPPVAPNIVMGLLNVVCQCFDHIVIDMPNVWHAWTDNIVLGSNKLFLVTDSTVPGVRKAHQLVKSVSAKLGRVPRPAVIVSQFGRRLFGPGLRRADLEKALGSAFACTVPHNRKLVREAIDRGVPLNEIQENSDVATAIKRLVLPRRVRSNTLLRSLIHSPTLNWARRSVPDEVH